jgi:hypothetical protein
MVRFAIASLIVAAAGSAQGAFFSFASDTSDQNWSFTGSGNKVYDGGGAQGSVPVTLLFDDDNGPLPAIAFAGARFDADVTITDGSRTRRGSTAQYDYDYIASGFFEFHDARGNLLLRCDFTNAQLSNAGSATSWGPKASIIGSDFTDATVVYTSWLTLAPGYGVTPGTFNGASDFGFDLTALNKTGAIPYNSADRGVAVSEASAYLPSQWWSEGSYSGSAVPSAGSVALLGLAASTIGFRRKR